MSGSPIIGWQLAACASGHDWQRAALADAVFGYESTHLHDIAGNGLIHPIIVDDQNQIADGRNPHQA